MPSPDVREAIARTDLLVAKAAQVTRQLRSTNETLRNVIARLQDEGKR